MLSPSSSPPGIVCFSHCYPTVFCFLHWVSYSSFHFTWNDLLRWLSYQNMGVKKLLGKKGLRIAQQRNTKRAVLQSGFYRTSEILQYFVYISERWLSDQHTAEGTSDYCRGEGTCLRILAASLFTSWESLGNFGHSKLQLSIIYHSN